ncbi:hypothetical protein BC628DRAFT_125206 [Trametes gibbosa]|nr:hypothetical protein BC628DRAFT_125206 [Trametes gibbosa]
MTLDTLIWLLRAFRVIYRCHCCRARTSSLQARASQISQCRFSHHPVLGTMGTILMGPSPPSCLYKPITHLLTLSILQPTPPPTTHTRTNFPLYNNMAGACTCQNVCNACGPNGSGCACPSGECSCSNCANRASACGCEGKNECVCAKQDKACSCGK